MTAGYDVVIAGGGPSGSAAAWQAAQSGARVAVLDKAEFPRDKPCGDGLTARGVSYLQKMGLAKEVAEFHRINRVTVFSPHQWGLGESLKRTVKTSWPPAGIFVPMGRKPVTRGFHQVFIGVSGS